MVMAVTNTAWLQVYGYKKSDDGRNSLVTVVAGIEPAVK